MTQEIQSILAVAIVVITSIIFVVLQLINKQKGCPGNCGCSSIPKKHSAVDSSQEQKQEPTADKEE